MSEITIKSIPNHMLERGSVVSVMDRHKPLIESFTSDGQIVTIAFVGGLPMEFHVFLSVFCRQFAPNITAKNTKNIARTHISSQEMHEVWNDISLPSELKASINSEAPFDVVHLLVYSIRRQFLENKEEEQVISEFKEFIRTLDEAYESSLVHPIPF